MNSETEYTLCNLDSHHGYHNTYASNADIYGFHNINGRGSLDTGQTGTVSYYSGDASLSPQLATPGELPLGSGGSQQMSSYSGGSVGVLSSRGANRGHHQVYSHNIPTSHHHQHPQHHQNSTHHHAHNNNSGGSVSTGQHHHHHAFTTHDLSMTTSTDCYPAALSGSTQHSGQQHSLTTAPNFLEIASMRSSYHNSGIPRDTAKYGTGSPGPACLVGAPVGLSNGYLPALSSSALKSEGCNSQQGIQGKPFRWMTIKRNPTKPDINHSFQKLPTPMKIGCNISSTLCYFLLTFSPCLFPCLPLVSLPSILLSVERDVSVLSRLDILDIEN
ncbi:unnamed protein product [Candidula unifasciata]|uniref:Uncharacterized protein n=1 Tax=Candidula unifasciata TaxID=100452 RepID=A0A8S3ZNC7_9EUPU|nr:unnamed protein product [Candidula unifasciata]